MNHRLAVHELQNAFPCTVCEKVFRWKASLKRHMEKHHVKDKMASAAYCAACGISFSSVCSYQRHMKNSLKHVTQEQLRFICDHCNKRFADKTKLRDHIEEKHLHRTYQCHICHKPSKNRVGLDQHIRNVHRGRPNNKMCHHCGKGFPTKVQLESHIRTHTGERPFICEFCPTTFSQQSNLYKHNRQVHLNIKSKRYPLCKKTKQEEMRPQTVEDFRPVAVLHFEPERGFL
ncbi:gastrula zinc finger protein XlCGF62.1-like [Cydia splendana]|uniref:gastrula zinc finger protein XlCGF62.1-like n=1 Tax=Cydia splendana TaxID=1100963 RepID=UPI00300C6284